MSEYELENLEKLIDDVGTSGPSLKGIAHFRKSNFASRPSRRIRDSFDTIYYDHILLRDTQRQLAIRASGLVHSVRGHVLVLAQDNAANKGTAHYYYLHRT